MTQVLEFTKPVVKVEKPFDPDQAISNLADALTGISNQEMIEELLFEFKNNYENHVQKALLDKDLFFTGRKDVTDEDVFRFFMLSVKTKMKLIKRLTNETPFKSWMEVERKMRLILNHFSNDLDESELNPHDPHRLFEITALAFLGMIQFGKWGNVNNGN